MPQTYLKRSNTTSKIILVGVLAVIAGILGLMTILARSSLATGVGVEITQPVAFSHRRHAGELQMDCRYCHTSAETSNFAGMPTTQTCMNCHTLVLNEDPRLEKVRESWVSGQALAWRRVNNLPDFVYFDHSIHLAKGVGCAQCHGRVDEMDVVAKTASLQMKWCLECHRAPEKFLRPPAEVFNMAWTSPPDQLALGKSLAQEHNVKSKMDCSVCHR